MEKVLKYTENEVNFDSVKIPQILYEHGPLGRKGKIEYNDDEVTHIDDKPFINAVDIDWNGIEVENNNRINTTADLINWIKSRSTGSSGGSLPETISVPITCYRWYHILDTPNVPTENSEEPAKNDTYEAIPESKWSKYALNRPEGNNWVLYLCSGTKEGKSYSWRSVTRISGIDRSIGEDSKDREWIYKVFNEELNFLSNSSNPAYWDAAQQDDYFGPNGWLWSDNPLGVSKENKFEYASYRDYKNKLWTRFSTPILWSHYGVNGIDGDGVEYCYVRTVSKEAPEVVVNNIENELTDEYKPLVKIESLAGYNNTKLDIKGEGEYYQDGGYSYTRCTDDPKGVDGTFQYEWVIVRKKDEPNDNGTRKWKRYSGQMSLWSSFTVNVDPAITIKDGFLWGDGDYIRDGDGNPIQIEGGDGSQGVETIGCPEEDKTYKPGTISVCENKVKIYYNDQWIDFGEGSGSGKYIHVAYAKTIDFDEHRYDGFSTTNSNDGTIYDWMGIMFDDSINDPIVSDKNINDTPEVSENKWNDFIKYKWNYVKGRDGNGVEYIFMLSKEGYTPEIDLDTYTDSELSLLVSGHSNRDEDEFLPIVNNFDREKFKRLIWYDDPPKKVSEDWPVLWKAIRKKVNGNWRDFYPPKIENLYFSPNSLYSIVTTNDTIVIDDLTVSSEDIKNASLGELSLYYNSEIVENGVTWSISNYNLPTGIIFDNIKEEENSIVFKSNTFKLKRNDEVPVERFDTGQFYFYVLAKVNNSPVAEKKIGLIIKDISGDGSFYKLIILNDSLSYTSGGGSNNNQNPIVNIKKIRNGQAQEVTLNNIIYNVSDIDRYNLTGLTLFLPNNIQYKLGNNYTTDIIHNNKPINLPIELDSIRYQSGGYEITLYYNDEIVDSEHIDCIKDGANGVVSAYIITSDNDTIVLDDLSTSKEDLESASSGTLTLIYNNTPVIKDNNNNLTWAINGSHDIFLPYSGLTVDLNENTGAFKVKYKEDDTATVQSNFVKGLYYFIISAKINNSIVAQKKIAFIVKNISIDGSFYRLVILNDSQSYKSDGTPNNNSNPIISVHKIKDGKSEQITENIKLINETPTEDLGITLVIPDGLYKVSGNYSTVELPLTLTNGVIYKQGGYDIALYYNKELLDAEHIDCIKDGKDASISDGITIKSITRYYQAKASDLSYVPSHKGNKDDGKDGWYGTQSAAGWSASNPYLYIQDKTIYNNDDESWGPVELYSYWGNENYDLVVSPLHIILDEKVNEENENRSYSGTNKVTVTLYKSGTENTIITKITNDSFILGSSSVTDNEITISVNNNNLSEGYLSFTIKGYEVYENENSPFVFIRQVKVPVYINRAESALFRVEGELKLYAVEQDGLRETTYNAKIEATQKTLRSEYTEKIKYVEDRGRNLFGFNKDINWQPYTTLNPVIPFIQGYGIVVKNTGAINNIGIEKLTEDTETESFGNYIVSFSAKTNQNKTGSYTFLFCGRNAETVTVNQSTQSNPENPITIYDNKWVDITLSFNLNDISDEKLYGLDFMRKTDDSYAYLYVRHLKIELGDVATDFCEADEDLLYYGKGQLLNESTRSLDSGVTTETYKDGDNVEKKGYKFSYIASKGSTTDVVKYEYKASVGIRPLTANIVAGKVYTLSFWAAAKGNNDFDLCAKFRIQIQPTTTEIISNIGKIISGYSIDDKKGYITEGVSNNGETNVYITKYWTQFFIHFYATNTVSFNSITSLDMLQLLGNDNVNGSYWSGNIYFCDFMFQEGYVLEPSSFVSKIEQNARCISLAQQTGLTKAGIDIYNGKVDVQADQFTIRNSSGQKNMSVNENGDVEFRGVIKGTYNFKVQICDKSGNDTIRDDTDYFMFNVGMYRQIATLPNPMECPGRVINISIINRPVLENYEVFLYNYDNYTPFVWVDNTETPSSSEWKINFYDYRKIVVWSDPSLFARDFGWRVIDSEKWISQQDLISNEAINALKSNLRNNEVINTLVNVLQGKL